MFVYISKYRPERRSCQLQIYQTILQTKKRPGESNSEPFYMKNKTGDDLLSQAAARQVPSAQRSLTSVFEMGTGVASVPLSPDFDISKYDRLNINTCQLICQHFSSYRFRDIAP